MAIAEACGWKWQEGTEPTYGGTNTPRGWINPKTGRCVIALPDYLRDLNAIHEADSKLSANESSAYALELQKIISRDGKMGSLAIVELCIYATASQRAEAFLKAIGKWVD